jgi:hemerythrin-like domain-containing protein
MSCGVVNVAAPNPERSASRLAVDRLVREHSDIALLLLMLDSYFAALDLGESVDDGLLLDAITYLTVFVDGFHRAKEQYAVEAVASRCATVRDARAALEGQYRHIRDCGLWLRGTLERTLRDEPMPRRRLALAGFEYAGEMRRNMEFKETTVFPALAEALDANAWKAIDARVGPQTDPLFGETVHQRYAELFRELAARFGCEEEARYD